MIKDKKSNPEWDVIIIGGGASGMMAGGVALEKGKSVLVIDKNKSLGEKLKITGGGRCNITNAEEDMRALLSHYGKAEQFLYSSFSLFGPKDTFTYFERRGLPLVVQARKRVFPHTEKAYDVYKVLYDQLTDPKWKSRVIIKNNCIAKKLTYSNGSIQSIITNQGEFFAKSFILATGGMSHPETGSTGDGFTFLKDIGHRVKDPTPSIVPLQVSDEWIKMLAGVSLTFMKITIYQEGKKQFSKTGKILFTHFGLSGPLVLNMATKVNDILYNGTVEAYIDCYPDTNLGDLSKKIVKVFDANKNKILRTVFKEIAPEGTAKAIEMILPSLDFTTKVHSITKEERAMIARTLKALPLHITNLMGYDRAVVADGGVFLEEVDMKTMRSKLFANLFITGDLLNINRPSGGYGLQLCWTTGYIAGTEA